MRILVLSKRQYTNRDLIDDRFGRLRELPIALAAAGHEVRGVCLSYRPRSEGRLEDIQANSKVVWHLLNVKRLLPWDSKSYWRILDMLGRDFCPEPVWACSDAMHAILGVRVSKRLGTSTNTTWHAGICYLYGSLQDIGGRYLSFLWEDC